MYSRVHSFSEFDRYLLAAVCFFIACKSEDLPCELNSLVKVFHELKQKLSDELLDLIEQKLKDTKENILKLELALLQEINFDLEIELPYKYIEQYKKIFEKLENPFTSFTIGTKADKIAEIIKYAILYCHDSFMTPISLYFHPLIIACCCLKLALEYAKVIIPDLNGIPWYKWVSNNVEINEMMKAKAGLIRIYAKAPLKTNGFSTNGHHTNGINGVSYLNKA